MNGQRQPYLRNSRHEAERATRLLSATCGFPMLVTVVVVPVGAHDLTIKTPPHDVQVINRNRLRRWLTDHPEALDQPTIDAVYAAARQEQIWRPKPRRSASSH